MVMLNYLYVICGCFHNIVFSRRWVVEAETVCGVLITFHYYLAHYKSQWHSYNLKDFNSYKYCLSAIFKNNSAYPSCQSKKRREEWPFTLLRHSGVYFIFVIKLHGTALCLLCNDSIPRLKECNMHQHCHRSIVRNIINLQESINRKNTKFEM
jgi:hypothetical protein